MSRKQGSSVQVAVDPLLLGELVCPLTGGVLEISHGRDELISRAARLAFPIRDGIPVLIASEARRIDPDSEPAGEALSRTVETDAGQAG